MSKAARAWILILGAGLVAGVVGSHTGAGGVAGSALAGVLLGLLFMLSGSLLLPIVLHTLVDLRMLVILRAPSQQSSAARQ